MDRQNKLLIWVITVAGITGIICAIVITPEFVLNFISTKHALSTDRYETLHDLRWFSFIIGCLLALTGIFNLKFPDRAKKLISRPIGTMFVLILWWLVIAFINFIMKSEGLNVGTPIFFPFSEVSGPRINFTGIQYAILFLIALFLSLKFSERFNVFHAWAAGLMLIVIGNLAQGGVTEAFYKPFNAPFYYLGAPQYQQYYHEAVKITDWRGWLASFNVQQTNLLLHTRTHPPFVILLHYFILKISNNSLPILSAAFVFLSSLSIVLIFQIMRELELSKQRSIQFTILFSVIPAYNIYSAVSMDGIIASLSAIFLLGLILIMKRGAYPVGIILFVAGIVIANLFTFLALFLVATAGLIALREVLINKNRNLLIALFVCLTVMLFVQFMMKHFYGYDHVQAFMTAAGLEPKSLFNFPLKYLMTRLENITMLMIFLSFGISAVLFRSPLLKSRIFNLHDNANAVFLAGIIPVLLFFMIGGLYTGEGARILLFIYPFFLLPLRNIEGPLLRFLITAAGIQTIIMQTVGGYFW